MLRSRSSRLRASAISLLAVAAVSTATVACSSATSTGAGGASSACATTTDPDNVKLVLGVGSFSSAYWQEVIRGAQAVADSVSAELTTFQGNFDGQTQLNNVTAALAAGGAGTAVIVDPMSNAFTKPTVQAAQNAGAHIVTLWNRPLDAHPWDFGGGCWIAHTSFDGADSGQRNAEALFKAIGGSGNIVALQGVPDTPSNKQRIFGLQEQLAAAPQVTLLETQTADWLAAKAQTTVNALLAKHGDQIDGIFSANDDMAVGAVEALRSKGLNGTIPVTGSDGGVDMLNLIKSGDALSTMQNDAFAQGAYATAIAYASLVGDLKAADMTRAQRDFFIQQNFVTAENVDQALNYDSSFDPAQYSYDVLKKDFWAKSAGPIDDATYIPNTDG